MIPAITVITYPAVVSPPSAVYPGALYTFIFSGVLWLHTCICGTWTGRIICKTESWTSERIHNSCNCQRSFSFSGRLSLLDELYARQFPKISDSRISDLIQLQLSAGRGHYHGDHHFSTCGVKSTDPGKACRTAVVCFVWQQGCVVARYSEHLV